jgi:hypothetical protein
VIFKNVVLGKRATATGMTAAPGSALGCEAGSKGGNIKRPDKDFKDILDSTTDLKSALKDKYFAEQYARWKYWDEHKKFRKVINQSTPLPVEVAAYAKMFEAMTGTPVPGRVIVRLDKETSTACPKILPSSDLDKDWEGFLGLLTAQNRIKEMVA